MVLNDSFIVDVYRESEMPVCGYISGFFAGYISQVLGRTVQVHESRCQGQGNDFCEHVVTPAPKGAKLEHVLRGEIS